MKDVYKLLTPTRRNLWVYIVIAAVLLTSAWQVRPAVTSSVPVAASPLEPGSYEIQGDLNPVQYLSVIDGATLSVETLEGQPLTVRLIGVDVPETQQGIHPSDTEAAAFLAELLEYQSIIWLESDEQERDADDSLLAYVYMPNHEGEWLKHGLTYKQLNLEMIRSGFVQPLMVTPNVRYADVYREAVQE